jgi:hypothetical protein
MNAASQLPISCHCPLGNSVLCRTSIRSRQGTGRQAALVRQLEGLARRQSLVMVFELLDLIIEPIRSVPVLLIVTFRPEFQPPWTGQEQVSTLALNRLDRHDRRALVEQIGGGKALPDNVVAQIAERTDGVPLFPQTPAKAGRLRENRVRGAPARARVISLVQPWRVSRAWRTILTTVLSSKKRSRLGRAV